MPFVVTIDEEKSSPAIFRWTLKFVSVCIILAIAWVKWLAFVVNMVFTAAVEFSTGVQLLKVGILSAAVTDVSFLIKTIVLQILEFVQPAVRWSIRTAWPLLVLFHSTSCMICRFPPIAATIYLYRNAYARLIAGSSLDTAVSKRRRQLLTFLFLLWEYCIPYDSNDQPFDIHDVFTSHYDDNTFCQKQAGNKRRLVSEVHFRLGRAPTPRKNVPKGQHHIRGRREGSNGSRRAPAGASSPAAVSFSGGSSPRSAPTPPAPRSLDELEGNDQFSVAEWVRKPDILESLLQQQKGGPPGKPAPPPPLLSRRRGPKEAGPSRASWAAYNVDVQQRKHDYEASCFTSP